MKLTKMYLYPRGWRIGGVIPTDYIPAITICDWVHNNFIVFEYE